MRKIRRTAAGFSLIEIAIVLVVIGILLSGGLLALAPVVEQSRVSDTLAKMARIENALISYAVNNQCLPCPATATLALGNANVGRASKNAGAEFYPTGCGSTNACSAVRGIVPWVNLGLSEADATDSFGQRITYAMDADDEVQNSNLMIRNDSLTPAAVYPQGSLQLNSTSGSGTIMAPNTFSGAVFVLVSHGKNGDYAYNAAGSQRAGSNGQAAGNPEFDNGTVGQPFWQGPSNTITGANYFDDVVVARSASSVIQACGAGRCGNPG